MVCRRPFTCDATGGSSFSALICSLLWTVDAIRAWYIGFDSQPLLLTHEWNWGKNLEYSLPSFHFVLMTYGTFQVGIVFTPSGVYVLDSMHSKSAEATAADKYIHSPSLSFALL